MRSTGWRRRRVYPRVGGETVRETDRPGARAGLSPRGRGNLPHRLVPQGGYRSIPAWAGKPRSGRLTFPRRKVYPRVGGETPSSRQQQPIDRGLSPRGRGNPRKNQAERTHPGSIPAWAGKPATSRCPPTTERVYPRVGGETVAVAELVDCRPGLSPRGRGNRAGPVPAVRDGGSIPAWAGKPRRTVAIPYPSRVYPRVGGETPKLRPIEHDSTGLSPRGRGNPVRRGRGRDGRRSIPAWAGKPADVRRMGRPPTVYPRVGGETAIPPTFSSPATGLSPRGRGNPGRDR